MPNTLAILPSAEIEALIPVVGAEVLGAPLPDDHHDVPPLTPVEPPSHLTRASEVRDLLLARALGADAARLPEHIGRTWADLEPLLALAWAARPDACCSPRHDWRLTFRAVRQGWNEARANSTPGSTGSGPGAR